MAGAILAPEAVFRHVDSVGDCGQNGSLKRIGFTRFRWFRKFRNRLLKISKDINSIDFPRAYVNGSEVPERNTPKGSKVLDRRTRATLL